MDAIEVCYDTNKAGTYIQFRLPIHAFELQEINAYDKFMRKNIEKDFKPFITKFGMTFSTDTSYYVNIGGKDYLITCLNGESKPELDRALDTIGVKKGKF